MNVTIVENSSKKAVVTYTVHISYQNDTPSDEEYFSSAWNSAVNDGIVDPNARGKHSFLLEKQ